MASMSRRRLVLTLPLLVVGSLQLKNTTAFSVSGPHHHQQRAATWQRTDPRRKTGYSSSARSMILHDDLWSWLPATFADGPTGVAESALSQISMTISDAVKDNAVLEAIQAEEHPFQYLFMFPLATCVAICCQLAGIGGAAVMSPVFLLVFPVLGPEYPLHSAASSIATALLMECFGFASGLSGYALRGLVDWTVALQFLAVSIPSALGGALLATSVASNTTLLRGVYAALMIGLAAFLTFSPRPETMEEAAFSDGAECDLPELKEDDDDDDDGLRHKTSADGTKYTYLPPETGSVKSAGATASGGILTGLLGVGVGEVVLPQLVRSCCMPLPVAAGTSVFVVATTALTAAVIQFLNLAAEVAGDRGVVAGLVDVVPWSLIQFAVPGALLGGQIAPYLASQGTFDDEDIERFAAGLFGTIGIAFAVKTVTG